MTRKQEDKRAIIFMKDKRTSPMQGTSTYDREEREDNMTTSNEDTRTKLGHADMIAREARQGDKYNTRTR